MLETKTWNVLHFALHFRHIHIVKYLLETVKINLSMMLEEPRTIDEVEVKSSSDALFGFKLVIFKKDDNLLRFLYE